LLSTTTDCHAATYSRAKEFLLTDPVHRIVLHKTDLQLQQVCTHTHTHTIRLCHCGIRAHAICFALANSDDGYCAQFLESAPLQRPGFEREAGKQLGKLVETTIAVCRSYRGRLFSLPRSVCDGSTQSLYALDTESRVCHIASSQTTKELFDEFCIQTTGRKVGQRSVSHASMMDY
jgi:hypothetical protein